MSGEGERRRRRTSYICLACVVQCGSLGGGRVCARKKRVHERKRVEAEGLLWSRCVQGERPEKVDGCDVCKFCVCVCACVRVFGLFFPFSPSQYINLSPLCPIKHQNLCVRPSSVEKGVPLPDGRRLDGDRSSQGSVSWKKERKKHESLHDMILQTIFSLMFCFLSAFLSFFLSSFYVYESLSFVSFSTLSCCLPRHYAPLAPAQWLARMPR